MSGTFAPRAALLALLLVLAAVALAWIESAAADDDELERFVPSESVRADATVPFPVDI